MITYDKGNKLVVEDADGCEVIITFGAGICNSAKDTCYLKEAETERLTEKISQYFDRNAKISMLRKLAKMLVEENKE